MSATTRTTIIAAAGCLLSSVFLYASAAQAEDKTPVPHPAGEFNYQCGQGGSQAFVPQNNGAILYMDCRNGYTRFVINCASLGKTLSEYNDDIFNLEEALKDPESADNGISLWNVEFEREKIVNEILPNLKIDRGKIERILKYAESFLKKTPESNPYQCALTN